MKCVQENENGKKSGLIRMKERKEDEARMTW